MTKKDYILIAAQINNALKQYAGDEKAIESIYFFAHNLSNKLKNDNPSFNENYFIKACGRI